MAISQIKKCLNRAFKSLENAGYYAKQNYWCCSSCAWSDIGNSRDKVVFYHEQDADMLRECGKVYLAWSGDAREIVAILKGAGLIVEWNGDPNTRILVTGTILDAK